MQIDQEVDRRHHHKRHYDDFDEDDEFGTGISTMQVRSHSRRAPDIKYPDEADWAAEVKGIKAGVAKAIEKQ